MREILFRGKRIDNGEWIEGFYGIRLENLLKPERHYIMQPTVCSDFILSYFVDYIVDPATVGQFTGLTDKNGKKIFEGDILRSDYDDDDDDCGTAIEEVVWHDNGWCIKEKDYTPDWMSSAMTMIYSQVIGNIHDNPELLEAEHD